MSETVLITGGTGVIGRRLTQLLLQQGFQVSYLSRSSKPVPNVRVFPWDVHRGTIDPSAVTTADYIIHLAGAGIADGRWTDERKQEIIDSRTQSTLLLARTMLETGHRPKSFVSSSAIGFYGGDTGDRILTESSPAGTDFMGLVTQAWEESVEAVSALGIRTVKLRTGVVLTMDGGALPKLVQPVRLGAGAPLGSGKQYVSWIHADDLCRMYIQAMTDPSWTGVYNAVAAKPVTNAELTRQIAKVLDKPLFLPNVPAFSLRLLFGEMAVVVLGSSRVLNQRIQQQTGFVYSFQTLKSALQAALT
ncbi:TIGR01777 family oxidoreductase [Tellurirhabdus rosea]|uniref:TIGR01777 family oxidoreductase n=1 Tax=Tellurirhabdus rosea TaxID=2674997 RepID=UPI0022508869|nr:TIGR01777 family oxidoreductase [Tellurirhabdus rosea]